MNIDKILTDKYCNKSVLSSYGSKTGVDLYDSYYHDLKSYQQILKQEFFDNLVSELIQETNVDDLKTLCKKSLNIDIVDNLDAVYKVLNDVTLAQNIPVCIEQQKNISYLDYCLRISEAAINNLQFILDNYAQLSDFQNKVEQLSDEKLSMSRDRISEIRLNKATLELELKELKKRRKEYINSNIFMKLFKYRENKKNDLKFNKLLITIASIESEEGSYTSHLEQLIKEAREELIAYIKAEDSTLFQEYIDRIQKCTKSLEIVDSKDFFIYSLYNYEQLTHEQNKKKANLNSLRKELDKSKKDYSESISIYKEIIGDNVDLLKRIAEIQNMNGSRETGPIICIYLLKLINDTNKLSFDDMSLLLNEDDKVKLNAEYQHSIESYLELEKSHIEELYFNYQFPSNTGYNSEEHLGFAKIKI